VRRSRRDEPEEDERPARRPRREEPEEEERPARRSRREEPEEEERPRRRASRDDRDDEPEERRPARRPRREEPEDDERPARRNAREDAEEEENLETRRPQKSSLRKGWKGYQETKAKATDYAEELRVTDDADLIKFLEDEPFAVYRQHWIETPVGTKKKSWTCLEDPCPMCDIGDRPRQLTAFNIVHLTTGGAPENKIIVLGNKAAGQLKNYAEDEKTGPLTRLYYSVSRSGKGQSSAYNWRPVKDRDLDEDWQIEPLSDDELDDFFDHRYDDSTIFIPSRRDMQAQADAAAGEDD